MKTIGLIGGMSWESSAIYYNLINQKIKAKLGGFHSAKCVMVSVDFAEIEQLQHHNDWDELDKRMIKAAQQLEAAGADLIVLCTNTMHLCSEKMIKNTNIPFLHIATPTAEAIQTQGLKKVALLGTKFTMEKQFYKDILQAHGIQTMIPNEKDRTLVHDIIYTELVKGVFSETSKNVFQNIIKKLANDGAEGVILGCTEILLLIKSNDVSIPIFDTTTLHSESAVAMALENLQNK